MKEKLKNNGAITTGIIAAIAASSCCIPPVIAAIAGIGSISSTFSWIEPLRPYLIGLSIIAIGYAWYHHFKPKLDDDCGCTIEKPKWYQSRFFLLVITIFAAIAISFPYYSVLFFPKESKTNIILNKDDIVKIEVTINGMTCDACENHVDHVVRKLNGIIRIKTSYKNGTAFIEFDSKLTNEEEIIRAIESTGYEISEVIKK